MNRKEAMEYNDRLKKELEQAALQYGLEESAGIYIVDNYITVLPEDARKGMIFLGKDPASYKAGNVMIDFKKALVSGFEFAASISRPESIFNYIQLIIASAFFIEKSVKQELSRLEAYAVYLLHKKGAYDTAGIEEERFISELQELYQQKEGTTVGKEDVVGAINNLYKIKAVDFNNGNIYLKEHMWGTVV
ncbi:MAG: hypothetical protein K2N63_08085 [Lachnospiraceae bacterium]|nr:hypothetical protein [Lachnospiraceae bacterium]